MLAIIGVGAMGEALLRGLLRAGVYAPAQVRLVGGNPARIHQLAQSTGTMAANSAEEAVRGAEAILVGVKPQIVPVALEPLREVVTAEQTVISVAAGVSLAKLEACFSAPVPVVRVMPNTPALVGAGATAIALGSHAEESHRQLAQRIFSAVGLAVDVDEKMMDAVTGLSGSGPAYVFAFIEALADGGVRTGLPRAVALRLAAQTVMGAAQMVLETGEHPGVLKDKVASPGGTTIAGLHALEKGGLRGDVMDAVFAAAQRSREMS
jgi:pyrroline-5-carboxylate reductase